MSFDLENDIQGQIVYLILIDQGHIVGSWQYIWSLKYEYAPVVFQSNDLEIDLQGQILHLILIEWATLWVVGNTFAFQIIDNIENWIFTFFDHWKHKNGRSW